MLIKIIVCLLTPLLFISFFKYFAKIMQSQHYEQRKYFGYIKDNLRPRKVYYHILAYFIMSFIVIFALDNYLRLIIFLLLFAVYLAYLSIDLRVNKDLKITSRIKRTLVSYYLLIFTSLLLVAIFSDNFIVDYALSIIFINLVSFLYVSLSFIVIYPLEQVVKYKYIIKARRKIKNNKDLVVIGVTGSYGKTSCKNMIYNLLEESFNVYKTPKSYNTQMGITLSINDPKFSNFTDYFVCEYGVDRKGGMKKLLKVVKPKVVLLTSIGKQHLRTFKSIERITSEKLSLAKSLNGDGLVVMNLDNEYLRGSVEKVKSKKITFAINNDADVMAKNIKITNTGSSFDLFIRGYKIKNIKFNLLGEHNILNLLGGIAVCLGLGIEIDTILLGVSGIKPIEHRLELKKIEGITVIDDSFNANEEGFKKAVDALSIMEKDRIIITPGIIEQGSNTIKVNSELGEYLVSKVDEVILVGENGRLLKDGLLKQNFDQNKIFLVDTFLQAWALVRGRDNINVLIENDLPEIYLK